MRDRHERKRVYEILILHGIPAFLIRWVDSGFLVDLWDDLGLPEPVRTAWEPVIVAASLGPRDGISDVADAHLQWRKEDNRARVAVRIEEARRQLGY